MPQSSGIEYACQVWHTSLTNKQLEKYYISWNFLSLSYFCHRYCKTTNAATPEGGALRNSVREHAATQSPAAPSPAFPEHL